MGTSARGPASAVVVESAGNPFTRTPRHRGQDQRRQHHGAHSVQAILHQGRHQGAITSLDMASEGPLADVPIEHEEVHAELTSDSERSTVESNDGEDEGSIAPHVGRKIVMVTGVDEVNDYYDVRIKRANLERLTRISGDSGNFRFYEGDICNVEFITKIFEDEKPRWMLHLAARAGVRPSI